MLMEGAEYLLPMCFEKTITFMVIATTYPVKSTSPVIKKFYIVMRNRNVDFDFC